MIDSAVAVARGRKLVQDGIEAARERRFGAACQRFLQALVELEQVPDETQQRKEMSLAAVVFDRAGHPDLALMALQRALELGERLGNAGNRCSDLLKLASTQMNLGQRAACEAANEAALALALANDLFADAASASTNVAILCANTGRLDEAIGRLQASLGYLTHDDHPDTDVTTRLGMIQVVDAAAADPALAVDAAPALFSTLAEHLDPAEWQQTEPAFRRCVDRYLAAHPELDARAWKRRTFPRVFASGEP